MNPFSRRVLLQGAAASLLPSLSRAAKSSIRLAFGTYGMKSLETGLALRTLREIGYEGVELCIMAGWPSDSAKLTPSTRRELRTILSGTHLEIPAIQESLPLIGTAGKREYNLTRLKLAAEIAHDIAAPAPVLDTIVGLKAGEWDGVKDRMAEELQDWIRATEGSGLVIAIKPHAGQALDNVERTRWLVQQVASSRLRVVYDYSHFHVEGFGLEESLRALLPLTAYIAVKDAEGTPERHDYLLPGDGRTDYVAYFRTLSKLGYRGYAGVEVSGQIHQRPGYDPVATARLCYQRLSKARAEASRP